MSHKFRSGLEQKVADQLSALKINYEYETMRIIYQKPAKYSYYKCI